VWDIQHPDDGSHDYYRYTVGLTHSTRISPTVMLADLVEDNLRFNCDLIAQDEQAVYSDNSVIVVEILFDQPQLLGVPVVSNTFTDPVPLYVNTTMRITSDSRSSGQ
jgi:hypothetical protein